MDKYMKGLVENRGLVCSSCQENINVHGCSECLAYFRDKDYIYCQSNSQYDSNHLCHECFNKLKKENKVIN